MKQPIKIAVIGGTGKSGKYLVTELLNQGLQFKMLLRNPENFQLNHSAIEILKGNAGDSEAVRLLANGCQAIISTIGQQGNEMPIFSKATGNILRAMNECNINRYIVTTGLSVDTPSDKKSSQTKFGTHWMKTNYPATTADKQTEYNVLAASNINWTLIRLPLIEQTAIRTVINISLEDCPGDKISATGLAGFLINQLYDDTYIKQAPFITNK